MQNKVLDKLFNDLQTEIKKLPDSNSRQAALRNLTLCRTCVIEADSDNKHNPPGKTVVRDEKGQVIGLQG